MTTLTNGNPDKLILIKESDLIKEHLDYYYKGNYVAIGIPVDAKGKDRKELMDEIQELYPPFKVVICANTDMFKTITKIHHKGKDGIACDSPLGKTFIVPNWRAIIYDSNQETRLKFIMERVEEFLNTGMSSILGSNVLQNTKYYLEGDDYSSGFKELYNHDALTVDIETTSLHHYNGVILSIAFSWNIHDGIAMQVSDNPKSINHRLAEEVNILLHSFVEVMVDAIDARSSYNANHTRSMVGYASKFVDWLQADRQIEGLNDCDYVSSEGAPLGTGVEVFYAEGLEEAYRLASSDREREHVRRGAAALRAAC